MKKLLQSLSATLVLATMSPLSYAQTTIKVFDKLPYFDGYAATVTSPTPPSGIIRHNNTNYARKLTSAELASIGTTLKMKVTIGALCDNYDRIGAVYIALVPKGATTYNQADVKRIEIARYITPFMNKNVSPTEVPYEYNVINLASILKETSITANYDFWVELEVFGVPYAAQTQISGCSGRIDVFEGSLEFTTNGAAAEQSNNVLIPVATMAPFRNYDSAGTDTIGKTTKTFQINVPSALTDASLFLITSNHGANQGGEEYNRRNHFAYFDGTLKLQYKPGRTSCEPFRQYNTQGNGIYNSNGATHMTDAQWQSFSNWCPGDVIDIRRIDLGPLTAGNHTFTINVPSAVFANGEGNIPLSLYLQGKTSGSVVGVKDISDISNFFNIYPSPTRDYITIDNAKNIPVKSINIVNMIGVTVYQNDKVISGKNTIPVDHLAAGIYLVQIRTASGTAVQKIQVIK